MELDDRGDLVIVAPEHWSWTHIESTLNQNLPRVERFLSRARQHHLPPLQYIAGEHHCYMGERYPLVIQHVKAGEGQIVIRDGELRVATAILQADKVKTSLQNWYQTRAQTVFNERLQVIANRSWWVKPEDVSLKLRRMKRTWGNCSKKGVIKLNTHLIKAPADIIDSVIAHELCHLQEMNHGREFYKLLEKLNPHWRNNRATLRSQGSVYLLT